MARRDRLARPHGDAHLRLEPGERDEAEVAVDAILRAADRARQRLITAPRPEPPMGTGECVPCGIIRGKVSVDRIVESTHVIGFMNEIEALSRGHGVFFPSATFGLMVSQALARLGIAVADAFIGCWRTKYTHQLLRPITYIRQTIEAGWGGALPVTTPPFPSTPPVTLQSAAAATVLTAQFGTVAFVDRTHEPRGLAPRGFASFEAAADEAAISRLYGGIHFRSAIERGLEQGRCIGERVARLALND